MTDSNPLKIKLENEDPYAWKRILKDLIEIALRTKEEKHETPERKD